jgi:hypothetical protein
VVALARAIPEILTSMRIAADRAALLPLLGALVTALGLGSCATGAPSGVKTVTVSSTGSLDAPVLQIAPGQAVAWAGRDLASDLVVEFDDPGAPQVRGTGATPIVRFDKPGRYPYTVRTRLRTSSGVRVERIPGQIVVGDVAPAAQAPTPAPPSPPAPAPPPPVALPPTPPPAPPVVTEPSVSGADVVRLRTSQDAARAYNYRPHQGIVVKIERTSVTPSALKAGEQVVMQAQYTLLTPPNSGQVKIREIWIIRFASSELGRMEKDSVLGAGTYTSQQKLKLPDEAPAGNYQLTTRIEVPQGGKLLADEASAALVVRPRSP